MNLNFCDIFDERQMGGKCRLLTFGEEDILIQVGARQANIKGSVIKNYKLIGTDCKSAPTGA